MVALSAIASKNAADNATATRSDVEGRDGPPYACTVGFSWLERSAIKSTLSTAPPSVIGRSLLLAAIVIVVAIVFVAGDSLIYLVARSLYPH
jgi:hypothetical protein